MFDQVKKILTEYTDSSVIAEASMLEADLGLSSLDVAFLVGDFEDVFGIEIADRDIPKFICVKDVLDYLESHT